MRLATLFVLSILVFPVLSTATQCCIKRDETPLSLATPQSGTWILETVDGLGKMGFDTDIAIDTTDTLHISYYDFEVQNLRYASYHDETWTAYTVDATGDVGMCNAIAVDMEGIPHISYYDTTNRDLKYATFIDNFWTTESVDTTGDVGSDNAIAVGVDGVPHISYYDATNLDLKYATRIGGIWAIDTVDMNDEVGLFTDIVVGTSVVHITYYAATGDALRYAVGTISDWVITDAISNVRVFGTTSITLDAHQSPHVCYYDLTEYNTWYLRYAYPTGSGWTTEVVDPNLYHFWNAPGAGIAVDPEGHVHIGYAAWKQWDLNYAWRTDGDWHVELVESDGNVGAFASLALDSYNYPHISYIDRSNAVLRYAHKIQYAPNNPDKPNGPSRIAAGKEYSYESSTLDMDGDNVKYGWDWNGDRVVDEWTLFYNSDERVSTVHAWNTSGTYAMRVMAEDTNGYQSNWSEPLSIAVPYSSVQKSVLLEVLSSFFVNTAQPTIRDLFLTLFTQIYFEKIAT